MSFHMQSVAFFTDISLAQVLSLIFKDTQLKGPVTWERSVGHVLKETDSSWFAALESSENP